MPIYRITAPLIEYCKKLQNVKITIRNAQVVGSSPIPSSRTNRFVKPFGEHGGFSFFRDLLSECAISAPFQKKCAYSITMTG